MKDKDLEIEERCIEFLQATRAIREKQKLSTTDLAEKTGLKQPNISRIEAAKYMPNLETLTRIGKGLGKKLGWIDE